MQDQLSTSVKRCTKMWAFKKMRWIKHLIVRVQSYTCFLLTPEFLAAIAVFIVAHCSCALRGRILATIFGSKWESTIALASAFISTCIHAFSTWKTYRIQWLWEFYQTRHPNEFSLLKFRYGRPIWLFCSILQTRNENCSRKIIKFFFSCTLINYVWKS